MALDMTRDMDRSRDTDSASRSRRLDADTNRTILMVGAGAIGSVVLMFLIEKVF
jgi:hypothetical protein